MPANAVDRKLPVKYSPEVAVEILEAVAEGKTLVEIETLEGMPSRKSIYKWLTVYPKFFDAFERAKEISALSFEEKSLAIAEKLEMANDFTAAKVTAMNYAMQQYRWSAARRDKVRYGQQTTVNNTVPITINTTLNLGQEGMGPATDNETSVYTITAHVHAGDDPEADPNPDEEVLDLAETSDDNSSERAFGLPEAESQQLHNPPNGRPPKTRRRRGHKTAAGTKRTAKIYAQNPDVPSEK